jgi:hypothetical protein
VRTFFRPLARRNALLRRHTACFAKGKPVAAPSFFLRQRAVAGALVVVLVSFAACNRDRPVKPAPAPGSPRHAVVVNRPAKLTSIETETRDGRGQPTRIACATCHGLRAPGPLPTRTADLREFHVGLTFGHGTLACAACHVAGRADQVHLADGARVPMTEVLRLCSQCHGPQARDFAHGAHGGMTGHWDLSAGPRVRNNCVDCHDPHAPRYRGASPAPRPLDRGGIVHAAGPAADANVVADLAANPGGHTP